MKLDFDKFPTIKNLAEDVREKALEYAATLGARGPRPTTVLGTAVTLANEWKSGRLPARPLSAPFLVQPRQGRWVIKRSTDTEASHTFSKKDDAVRRAQELAKAAGAACFVFGPGGTLIERYEAKALAQLTLVPELIAEPMAVIEPVTSAPEPMQAFVPTEPERVAAPIVLVTEPVAELAFEPAAEIVVESQIMAESEPAPGLASEEAPIRVAKVGGKWLVILGEDRSESFPTQKKAAARANALAKKLGRTVVIG